MEIHSVVFRCKFFGNITMRDVLDDDERKVKPVSLLMVTTAVILGSMIVYNAMWGKGSSSASLQMVAVPAGATTRMSVAVPDVNTVIIKYDPAIEDVQRELLALGQYKGMVDGVNGQRTKIAIQQYQQDNSLPVTGEVTPELINHIQYTRKVKAAAEFTGSIDPAPAVPTLKDDPTLDILKVQGALSKLGYDLGEPTGKLDDATRAAILKFEMENGLSMDGAVDAQLLAALAKPAGQ
jgi:peptidoglycan hydrolase-like protein with peptidoglycan-binding domain